MNIEQYVKEGWKKTLRTATAEDVQRENTLIALPKPFTIPCIDGFFQEMYYWDTYFTNCGLLVSGEFEIARDNLENFAHLVNVYGFIPNGSRTWFLDRSQPPVFGLMIADYYKYTQDKEFLSWATNALEKEYLFWDTRRKAENGLNCHSSDATIETYGIGVQIYHERTGVLREDDVAYWGKNILAEAETGWDFNPRFSGKCHEYNPVDLNSLLYFNEKFLAFAQRELGTGDGLAWEELAQARKQKMQAYMLAEDGDYYDYSYVENKRSKIKSAASFFPYFVGLRQDDGGIDALLQALELPYGISATQETKEDYYQWGYKNGWPCMQFVVVEGLKNCTREEDAKRIAKKYVDLVESVFEKKGKFFEKYNVLIGTEDAVSEYGTPEMLGWTAGVYLALKAFLA